MIDDDDQRALLAMLFAGILITPVALPVLATFVLMRRMKDRWRRHGNSAA